MIVKWLKSCIQFIVWLFACLDLLVIAFHLNYSSWYVTGCLTRSAYFVCLWNDHNHIFVWSRNVYFLISKSYSDWLMLESVFFLYLNYYSTYVIACLTKSNWLFYKKYLFRVIVKNIIIYPIHWLILYLLWFLCFSFHLYYCSSYVIGCFTRSDFFVWL